MKYRVSIYTLALLGALALAAISGGLLTSSDNVVYAQTDPVFDGDTDRRSVPENTPPGVNIGDPISATDDDETGTNAIEFGNTLTYSLQASADTDEARADAASFDIDASTGQLITKAPLDYDDLDNRNYSVTVTVDDGETRAEADAVTQDVTIEVTNEDEPPAAPFPPTVVSGKDVNTADETEESTTSLRVVWHPPENMGPRIISSYAVEYKKSTEPSFGDTRMEISDTTATIPELEPDTSYDVRVQATNGEGTGPWSFVGTGSTNKEGNSPPQSNEEPTPATRRTVDENTPRGGERRQPGDGYRRRHDHADLPNGRPRRGPVQLQHPVWADTDEGPTEPRGPAVL